jgi:hypothetical protein
MKRVIATNMFENNDINVPKEIQIDTKRLISNCNPHIKKLDQFFKNNDLIRRNNNDDYNVVNQLGGAYNITEEHQNHFFELLNNITKNNLKCHYGERQIDPSGIFLDFDIKQSQPTSAISKCIANLVKIIMKKIILPIFQIDADDVIYVVVRRRPEPYKMEENLYKDGFHIIIPSIMTTKNVKKFIIKQIKSNSKIKDLFQNKKNFGLSIEEILDEQSASVPPLFYGCVSKHAGKVSYVLEEVFEVELDSNGSSSPSICSLGNVKKAFLDKNMSKEFSILFEGDTITKKQFEVSQEYVEEIASFNHKYKGYSHVEVEELDYAIMTLIAQDNKAKEIRQLLNALDESMASRRDKWRDVVFAVAEEDERYKVLAMEFSKRCEEKWDYDEFERLWEEAIMRRSSYLYDKISIKSLYRELMNTNREAYERIRENTAYNLLHKELCSVGDNTEHTCAKVVAEIFKYKYITDTHGVGDMWFEFIFPNDSKERGNLYKYRKISSRCPDHLMQKVSDIICKFYDYMISEHKKYNESQDADEEHIKQNQEMIKLIKRCKKSISTKTKTQNVIIWSATYFREYGFLKKIDKVKGYLGVVNGVLQLDRSAKLINYYHNIPITKSTDCEYAPIPKENLKELLEFCNEEYDGTNIVDYIPEGIPYVNMKHVGKVIKAIRSILIEDDAYLKIMFYLSQVITGNFKEIYALIIEGPPSSGKSFILELIKSILGDDYAIKSSITLLTSSRGRAENANSAFVAQNGKRLVYYSESAQSEVICAEKYKEIVSQESQTGRDLYQPQQNFRLTSLQVILTNYPLNLITYDDGVWRRTYYYKTKNVFTDNPDPDDPYQKKANPKVEDWKEDNRYKVALLAILVEFAKRFQIQYSEHLSRVQSDTMDNYLAEFRNSKDHIYRYIITQLKFDEKTEYTDLGVIARSYISWYQEYIDKDCNMKMETIKGDFKLSGLKKYLKEYNNGTDICVRCIRLRGEDEMCDDPKVFRNSWKRLPAIEEQIKQLKLIEEEKRKLQEFE